MSGIVQQFRCMYLLIISEKGWHKCTGPQRALEEKGTANESRGAEDRIIKGKQLLIDDFNK